MPMGRKKWRSTHSSTDRPLCDKSFGGFTEHVLHDGEGAHRLVFLDDQRRGDAGLGGVDHGQHAARQQRSEERRVGEEGRSRWAPYHLKKKKERLEFEYASVTY